jgi:hypothetical protein
MRPKKARGLTQHGGPPGWLGEIDPAECDFVCDGRSMPPALADHTSCLSLGLIHRLNMELDRRSLFGLLCTAVLSG